jgi:hypothetical protein
MTPNERGDDMTATETKAKEVSFYSQTLVVKPCVGSVIVTGNNYRKLMVEDWSNATWEFRLPSGIGGPIKSFGVRIEVTGRTVQNYRGDRCVKVKVTVPGDCEPDGEPFWALMLLTEGLNFEYKG